MMLEAWLALNAGLLCRFARWNIFKPKIPIWVNFGWSCNERCWYVVWSFGKFCVHLVYFAAIWDICWSFCIFLPILVRFTKKNLATLLL
jgi:hypothetical protein